MAILNSLVSWCRLIICIAVLSLVASVSGCGGGGKGPIPIPDPGVLVGQVLSDLSDQVQTIIVKAGHTADGVLLTAAGAVQQDIDAAAAAFGDTFTKGINEVDATTKSTLDQLGMLTEQLNSQVRETVRKTTEDAAGLLVQIGIGANAPIVKGYGPRFTTAARAANGLDLHLYGLFPRAEEVDYSPILIVNGVTQPKDALTSNDLYNLTFRLPPQTFPDAVTGIAPPKIEVNIPYAKGHVFKSIVPGIFHIQIATLPNSPVKSATLTTTTPGAATTVPHQFRTEDVYLSSLDCRTHADDRTLTPRHGGWRFDPRSITPVIGDGYPKGPSGTVDGPRVVVASPTSITLHASTSPGTCFWPIFEGGRVLFHYTFVELEPVVSAPIVKVQALTLNWGDQLSLDVPQSPGTWHLEVVLWNGVRLTAPPTRTDSPWVTLKDLGTKVSYSAVDLSKVSLNDVTPL
jgi:hypothetical protein